MAASEPKCITVYASSSSAVAQSFKDEAYALGKAIAEAGMVQCNGGGRYGLMGAATDGGLENGGTVQPAPTWQDACPLTRLRALQ